MSRTKKQINIAEVTAEDYAASVRPADKEFFHLRIEQPQYDTNQTPPVKTSTPSVQMFSANGINDTIQSLHEAGYSVDVLFDPTKVEEEGEKKSKKKSEEGAEK